MNPKRILVLLPLLLVGLAVQSATLGTAFTYQGRLADANGAATGRYDFQFTLYDSVTNGTVVAGPLIGTAVGVTNGLFTVSVDFGSVFTGNARWLQIAARTNGSFYFTSLSPRQPLTAAPYATYALNAGLAALASGVSTGAITSVMLADGAVTSNKLGAGVVFANMDDGGSAAYGELMGMASGLRASDPLPFTGLSRVNGEAPTLNFRLDGASFGTVLGFSGREGLSEVYEYVVEVLVSQPSLETEAQIGRQGGLYFARSGRTTSFAGVVTGCTQASYRGDGTLYTFRIEPMLAFLRLSSDYRIYQDQTAPDVVTAVYSEATSNTLTKALSGSYPQRPLTIQFAETDLNFISRLLEYHGAFYFFQQTLDASPSLILGDGAPSYLAAPYAVRYYGNFPTNPHPTEECLREFEKAARAATGGAALNGYDFTAPRKNLLARSHSGARPEDTFAYDARVTQTADMDGLARLRSESQQVAHSLASGAGNAPDMRPGYTFTLDDQSGSGVGGSYVVTAVRHAAFRRMTNGVASFYYGNQVEVFSAAQAYRPALKTPRPVVPACTAVVVGKAGEEIWTDKYGRVKVQFRWDRYGAADETSSGWVRVASPWAGKNWGAIFVPRIGQEVLVEFVNGDPDQPVITGSFYNGDQMPPYDLPANATVSGIRTRSSKSGSYANANEIRFEDKAGSEALDITAERNFSLLAKNNLTITANNNLTINSLRGLGINTTNDPALALNIGGVLGATTFQGSGAGLSSVPAASLSGTVSDANLSLNIARLNSSQTFSGNNAFLGRISAGGAIGQDMLNIYGPARLNDNDLYLRGGADVNHGLGWYSGNATKPFGTAPVDGPVLYGCGGGALGTACNSQKMALRWDSLGRVGIDPHNQNAGTLASNALTFGISQTEGIASARSSSANLNGLDFFTAGTNRLAITAAGLVGIGTSTPSHLLQLHSNTSSNLLRLTGPGVNYSGGKLNFGDGEFVYLHEVTDDILRIQATRLGISRTPAINRFEVEGEASKTTAGGWIANSDARIKQDIEPVRDARAVLDQVRPVSFRYTDEYRKEHPSVADRRYLNVVAQEFREVFPDSVKPSGERLPDGSEILQVDTYPLTIYSAAAIRELNEELKTKDTKIRDLEQRLAVLEKLVLNQSK